MKRRLTPINNLSKEEIDTLIAKGPECVDFFEQACFYAGVGFWVDLRGLEQEITEREK